jgi:hypothetical protein
MPSYVANPFPRPGTGPGRLLTDMTCSSACYSPMLSPKGAYDTTKSWYTWSRSWYGYLFLGEKGSAEDAAGRNDEVVDVRCK